jgi:hypothetical protein
MPVALKASYLPTHSQKTSPGEVAGKSPLNSRLSQISDINVGILGLTFRISQSMVFLVTVILLIKHTFLINLKEKIT